MVDGKPMLVASQAALYNDGRLSGSAVHSKLTNMEAMTIQKLSCMRDPWPNFWLIDHAVPSTASEADVPLIYRVLSSLVCLIT